MDIALLAQFSQRLLALDRGQSHFRFKSRCVVPAWSFAHRLSCLTAILAAFRQKLHLSRCPNSSGHFSSLGMEASAQLAQLRMLALKDLAPFSHRAIGLFKSELAARATGEPGHTVLEN